MHNGENRIDKIQSLIEQGRQLRAFERRQLVQDRITACGVAFAIVLFGISVGAVLGYSAGYAAGYKAGMQHAGEMMSGQK
jgi:hypothetical protein